MLTRRAALVSLTALAAGAVTGVRADAPFGTRLSNAALARLSQDVRYDAAYTRIPYPMGDVPADRGVCSDEIIRAYRALGIDLQQRVHEDMAKAFASYPQSWGLSGPDRNIDHRRVPNLERFFTRHGDVLPLSRDAGDYLPGELVTWRLGGRLPHIGIVTHKVSSGSGRPLIEHNVGAGPSLDDVLFTYPMAGHFRYWPAV